MADGVGRVGVAVYEIKMVECAFNHEAQFHRDVK